MEVRSCAKQKVLCLARIFPVVTMTICRANLLVKKTIIGVDGSLILG